MTERKLEAILAGDAKGFSKALGEADGALGKFGTALKGFGAVAGVAGATAGALLAKGFADAMDAGATTDKFAARLGLDAAESARLGKLSGDIYAGAWGDSLEEVNVAVEGVSKNLSSFATTSDADMKNLTTQALDIASAFDLDVNEAIMSASSMLRTGLAPDAETAFDIITLGLQTAGGESGELLESLNEYSEQFASLGIDGQTAVRMLSAGFEAGAFSVDKVGDAVKEFSIRAIDGSSSTADAFRSLGLDADEMAAKIAGGGPAAEQAMGEVISALGNVGDAVAQDAAGVALFGSMWEDVGPDVIAAINPIKQEVADIGTITEDMGATLNDNLATSLEEFKRTALLKLQEVGAVFVGFAEDIVAAWREGGFGAVVDLIGEQLRAAAPIVRDALAEAAVALWQWLRDSVPPALAELGNLIGSLVSWLTNEGLPSIRTKLGEFLPIVSQAIADAIPVVAEKLGEMALAFVQWVIDAGPPLLLELGKLWFAIWSWINFDLLPKVAEALVQVAAAFVDWVLDVVAEIPGKLGELWGVIRSWFTNDAVPGAREGAASLGSAMLEFAITFLRELPGKLAGMLTAVVRGVIGWHAAVANLAVTVAGWLGNFALDFLARLPGWLASMLRGLVTGLLGWIGTLLTMGGTIATKIKDGIISGLSDLWQRLKNAMQAALSRAVSALNPVNIGSKIVTSIPGAGTVGKVVGGLKFWPTGGEVPPGSGPQISSDGHLLAGVLPNEVIVNPARPSRGLAALADSGVLDGVADRYVVTGAAAGGGRTPVNINVYALDPDPESLGRATYDGLRRYAASNGPLDLDIA